MIYLRYHDKVEKIVDCKHCQGKGSYILNPGIQRLVFPDGTESAFHTGTAMLCTHCTCGKIVTYPWTRGRSLPPKIPRAKLRRRWLGN